MKYLIMIGRADSDMLDLISLLETFRNHIRTGDVSIGLGGHAYNTHTVSLS